MARAIDGDELLGVERIFSTPKITEKGGYRPKGVFENHG